MPKIKTHKGTAKVFTKRKNDIKIAKAVFILKSIEYCDIIILSYQKVIKPC